MLKLLLAIVNYIK